jgi:hypothetical protein
MQTFGKGLQIKLIQGMIFNMGQYLFGPRGQGRGVSGINCLRNPFPMFKPQVGQQFPQIIFTMDTDNTGIYLQFGKERKLFIQQTTVVINDK